MTKTLKYIVIALGLQILFSVSLSAGGNRYFTRTGFISFISSTPLIDIEGTDRLVTSFLDIRTGEMVFSVFIKDFKFKLELAEEHFNENYMYSEQFPQAKFKGKIVNIGSINFAEPGKYEARVEGMLTIKDRSNQVSVNGTFEVKDGKIAASSTFSVQLKDYNIGVPKIVDDKVAKVIPITVRMIYEPYTK